MMWNLFLLIICHKDSRVPFRPRIIIRCFHFLINIHVIIFHVVVLSILCILSSLLWSIVGPWLRVRIATKDSNVGCCTILLILPIQFLCLVTDYY